MTTETLGYYFYPNERRTPYGHPALAINIFATPTEKHFDPERVRFCTANPNGDITPLTVTHPWRGQHAYRLCTGQIELTDRKNKSVEAFSLGGTLTITTHPERTHCLVESPAPIIPTMDLNSPATILVAEFEGLLARARATCGDNEAVFTRRLGRLEPLELFVAALVTLRQRLRDFPEEARRGGYDHVDQVVERAIDLLKSDGRWPTIPPTLDALLKCE